jgi:hypothetical protein
MKEASLSKPAERYGANSGVKVYTNIHINIINFLPAEIVY